MPLRVDESVRSEIVREWEVARVTMGQAAFCEMIAGRLGTPLSPRTLRSWIVAAESPRYVDADDLRVVVVAALDTMVAAEDRLRVLLGILDAGATSQAAAAEASGCHPATTSGPDNDAAAAPGEGQQAMCQQKGTGSANETPGPPIGNHAAPRRMFEWHPGLLSRLIM